VPRYSETFKRKMVGRLTGPNAVSATTLAKETGLKQQTLSFWLEQARSLPFVSKDKRPNAGHRSVEEKSRLLSEAGKFSGDELLKFLDREGVSAAELEQWRLALEDGGVSDIMATKRIRALERELARKEKALAEAAALIILKKKFEVLFPGDEDDESDGGTEK
jgi:transposase